MKKYLILIILLFGYLNVYAFEGKYNYEVTNINRNDNGDITVNGWAIPNAGVDDGHSPRLNPDLGSGASSDCKTNNKNNHYVFTLYALGVDSNKNINYNSKKTKLGSVNGSGLDLTKIMCRLDSKGKCIASKSSCYQNVGWSFSFNQAVLTDSAYQFGYVLYLEIYATGNNSTVGFPLVIYNNRISGFGSDYSYTTNNMKVQVIAYDGYFQRCSNGTCQRKNYNKFKTWNIYDVLGVTTNYKNKLTYYKVGNNLYIPASWVAPPSTSAIIFPPKGPIDVKNCTNETIGQLETKKEIKACSGSATLSGNSYASCKVDSYSYYTKKCYENPYTVDFKINDLEKVNKFTLSSGAGFSVDANIKTNIKCLYTFDSDKFTTDYNNVLTNINYYESALKSTSLTDDSKRELNFKLNENLTIKKNLDNILTTYKNQTQPNNWDPGYDFSKIKATLVVEDDTVNLENNITSSKNCKVTTTKTISLLTSKETINTEFECSSSYEIKYNLPEVCLNLKNGNPEKCDEAKSQIEGGRKYYIDLNKKSGNIALKFENLGYDQKWQVNLNNCVYESNLLKEQVIFRQIDLNDPFLQSYTNNKRKIGKNYKNNKFNFLNIIKPSIWDNLESDYKVSLSKTNVDNIKNDTSLNGASSYLGSDCSLKNNKYVCNFLNKNNQDKFFTKIEVKEDKIS